MSRVAIEIYANPNIHSIIDKVIEDLKLQNRLFNTIPIRVHSGSVASDIFYAENEISRSNGEEIFSITISDVTPKNIVEEVLNIELHKAILYFTNDAVKAFRWYAGKIFYNEIESIIERSIYARLVDTVENKAVVETNPKLSKSFLKVFIENEIHDNTLDYMLSQVMLLPIISKEYVTKEPDEEEALAYVLATYGEEILRKPTKEKGAQIAKELLYLTKSIL